MSKYVIEIELPFVFSIAPFVTSGGKSYLRLCDGEYLGICDVGGTKNYLPNYLKSVSPIVHGADLMHGGNLENEGSLTIDIIDSGILEMVENAGLSINAGIVRYGKLDNLVAYVYQNYEQLYFGYVDGCTLKDGILSISSSTVDKGLGLIPDNRSYGYVYKRELKKEESISNTNYQFQTVNNTLSDHPRIVSTISTQNSNPFDNYYGVTRSYIASGNVSIIIGHYNDAFKDKGLSSGTLVTNINSTTYYLEDDIIVKFWSGENESKEYRVSSIVRLIDGNGTSIEYRTKLNLKETVFENNEIKAFDRISISSSTSYYLVNGDGDEDYTGVFVNSDNAYYKLNTETWSVVTLNGKKYLKVSSRQNVYSEVPTTVSVSYRFYSSNGFNYTTKAPIEYNTSLSAPMVDANVLDTDMSSYFAIDTHTRYTNQNGPSYTINSELKFDLTPDLSNFAGKELYFGGLIDRPIEDRHTLRYNIETILKSGEIWPCSTTTGLEDFTVNPIKSETPTIFQKRATYLNSAPIGDISYPVNSLGSSTPTSTTVIDGTPQSSYNRAFYTSISNPTNFFTFDPTKMTLIDIDEDVYKDISVFRFCLNTTANFNPATMGTDVPYDSFDTFVYRIGIWSKITIDSPDSIFIDVYNPGTNPDRAEIIIKKIIESSGNDVVSDYGLTVYDYQRTHNIKVCEQSDRASDIISDIAHQSNIVVGQTKEGDYYIESIDMIRPPSAQILDIPSSDIYSVVDSLSDVDISEVINFPLIKFRTQEGLEESIEVINLDGTFPTSAAFVANPNVVNSFFKVSANFYSKIVGPYYWLESVYDYIFLPLYTYCKASYDKNGVKNTGDIDITAFYLDSLNGPTVEKQFFNYLLTYTVRRKTLTISVPMAYKDTVRLGTSVSILDPRLYNSLRIFGYVSKVEFNPIALTDSPAYCNLSIITDSYKIGDAFFFF